MRSFCLFLASLVALGSFSAVASAQDFEPTVESLRQFECPECKKETEVFSRIVGYYRPVQNWNKGKKEEYKFRDEFKEDLGLGGCFRNELLSKVKKDV